MTWLCVAIASVAASASANEAALTDQQREGRLLFEATCIYCHQPRGWATEQLRTRLPGERAVLAERTDLDFAYIRFTVRNGLVNMPAYTPTDLTEGQIRAVAAYLMRRSGSKP